MTVRTQINTLNEHIIIIRAELDKIKRDVESIKIRMYSNDCMVWEMFSAIIDTLHKNNIIVNLPVQAKYDPNQTKLNKND